MRAKIGEAKRFFEMSLVYESDECCIWPFSRNPVSGYAMMSVGGRPTTVSRKICEREHGPAPTDKHEAAHVCGMGHLGCINKRHLQWKTPKENTADQLVHGTRARGERNGRAILTDEQVTQIRKLYKYVSGKEVADKFGISQQLVCDIRKNRRWQHLVEDK